MKTITCRTGEIRWVRDRCTIMAIPAGLLVEREEQPVAILDEPLFEDMFWFSWRITPLTSDPRRRAEVLSDGFWTDSQLKKTIFRCEASGAVAGTAFRAGPRPVRQGRLVLRGAYVPVAVRFRQNPLLWLRLLVSGGQG